MPDIFSTDTLLGVVEGLKTPNPALLGRYFPTVAQDEAEEIHFDIIKSKRRIAPFVSPLVAGRIVTAQGYRAATFQPAYIKDKRNFDPNRPFRRIAGEQIGGSLTPQQRLDAALAGEMQDQINMIARRLEVMASEALRTGKVTVSGDGYGTVVVDFERAAALSPATLGGTDVWGDVLSTPLDDLADGSVLVLKESGANPMDVVMGVDAFKAFRNHASVKDRLDTRRITDNQMAVGTMQEEGLAFKGTIDGFNIFVYAGWYVDPATETETEIWPAKQVGILSSLVEGVRFFGAIRDPKAGLRAMPFFPKSWMDEDPAVTWLMMQSAPLVVPTRVDATYKIQVLA